MDNNRSRGLLVALDVGGTNLRVVLANIRGRVLYRQRVPIPLRDETGFLDNLLKVTQTMLRSGPPGSLLGIGVAIAGPVDCETGTLVHSPHLPDGILPVREAFSAKFNVPVVVENDASAAAFGELHRGTARGSLHMVYVTLSTGIGGGLILNGELYRGSLGGSGEVGHMVVDTEGPSCDCGRRGCLEAVASGSAIARRAISLLREGRDSRLTQTHGDDLDLVDAAQVHWAAIQGDRLSREILAEAAQYLGLGLANLGNIFNPQLIVLGGGLCPAQQYYIRPAIRLARKQMHPLIGRGLRFRMAKLGDDAGIIGVLLLLQGVLGIE